MAETAASGGAHNIHLTLAYDGTDFHGWQVQPGLRTVEGVLESALSDLEGLPVDVHGASRTDQGVHALGQSASFVTSSRIPVERYVKALNARLPLDLRVCAARSMPLEFHARFSAVGKHYRYCLDGSSVPAIFSARYTLHYPYPSLRLDDLRLAAKVLEGEHDFASFQCQSEDAPLTSVRRVDAILVTENGSLLHIDVWGRSFLYKMVRTMVGTLLEVGRGKWSAARVKEALEARDRRLAGPTAPAHGLTLCSVAYELAAMYPAIREACSGPNG